MARNKHAMLIAKQNNMPVVVVTDSPHVTNNSVTIADGVTSSPICYLMLFDDMLAVPFKARVNTRRKTTRKIEPLPITDDE